MRELENLSKFQRRATPLEMCRYLVKRVRERFNAERVAVLWVEAKSHYWRLWPEVELWGKGRDARTYAGPHPIIAHPPCGPWGKFKGMCFRQAREDGIYAIDLVHRWGGVIEQPLGSTLFQEHGRGGEVEMIKQGDHGHLAEKATLLYWAWR